MFIYGKTAANAISVMSYLADEPKRRAGSGEIAEVRGISRALTAKLLTQLASAGLVHGQPGPGGGYTLAREAKDICLLDIVSLFEQIAANSRECKNVSVNWKSATSFKEPPLGVTERGEA